MSKVKVHDHAYDIIGNLETNTMPMVTSAGSAERPCTRIHFNNSKEEVEAMGWTDNVKWSVIIMDEKGVETEIDKSDICLRGDLVLHSDGTTSVYMCRTKLAEDNRDLQDIIEAMS